MWKRISLRTRILLALSALVLVTVGGGLVSIFYGYLMDKFVTRVTDSGLVALQAAQELENAICMQKGFVSYYFQDSDPMWLEQLEKHHHQFEDWLKRARMTADTPQERDIINQIEANYVRYSISRAEVVALYKEGKKEAGFALHKKVRFQFLNIIELCNEYKDKQQARLASARDSMKARAQLINLLALVALFSVIVLAVVLAYTLLNQILGPIRQLALETSTPKSDVGAGDEVAALSLRFHNLIADVDQTKSKLKWSREHLQQAEKWALVGKLAAGVAHSVRNPLTSVKMRLFSMERSLALSSSQKEDFEVITEEIRHIDTIVGNFLEFSRPPKLKMQKVSPSDAVDMAIQLLHHRLESYDVRVEVKRDGRLPEILADPDQLKEVLVNLIVNACEAMVNGGEITIEERQSQAENLGPVVIIRVSDNGPGVPESIQAKLFQPFFSTKEEGTGLGLSIATRIVEEHGGWLDLKSREGEGAAFIITLPAGEEQTWQPS
ncbi:MAG: MCP four helix bundle domain-containing protein [Desulfomonile tiedjei]|nr:MCP four helix bundle domain-containing protein [Desulfomonile tiedjei]